MCSLALLIAAPRLLSIEVPQPVNADKSGHLTYVSDAHGDRIPDFSAAGYGGGGKPLPVIPARVTVSPVPGDNGPRIQAAIDFVSTLPLDSSGHRGAVLLAPGRFEIVGQLRIRASGVVLRGSGENQNGTALVAAGTDRRALIQVQGKEDRTVSKSPAHVTDPRVAVGATHLHLSSVDGLKPGSTILVSRPSPKNWIADVGMDLAPGPTFYIWKPGSVDLQWERTVVSITGDEVTLDAPLTTALESRYGGGTVAAYGWNGRLREVGIENLRCESAFDASNPLDEQHAWMALDLEAVENCWVRNVAALHFASSLVQVGPGGKSITVQDCWSLEPVSEVAGYRRNTYHSDGQLVLFLRCQAADGRNDFTVGYLSAGPTVFLDCSALRSTGFSGSLGSWASGLLFDNVDIDGGSLRFDNLETWNQGVGWSVANSVIWQTSVSQIIMREPPGASNWAVGAWAEFVGDGRWTRCNGTVKPVSLYRAQLADRLSLAAVRALEPEVAGTRSDSALRLEEAVPDLAGRLAQGVEPARWGQRAPPLALADGWLTRGGRLMIGKQIDTAWWRGFLTPKMAPDPGRAITRFAPGRAGTGLTDDLDHLTDGMVAAGEVAFRNHWGLWYDERSDDHERTRRPSAEVWPPFYEQPWLRSGQGNAWDGLSRYDLSRYNPWYFQRLRSFAELGRAKGLILVDEMYFQHNILEDGAHYANFPWRTANNINHPGFPEPPPYFGDKWISMAKKFYDMSDPVRRRLNEAYIRHCLDNLAEEPNVIHTTGEEFTGPLSFVQFWLDTASAWSESTGHHPLLALSTTKDVQDAILADPVRSRQIGVIEFKYWWLSPGGLFDPKGGKDRSPRQSERLWGSRPTALDLAQMARDYRRRFPDKAVIANLAADDGWAFVAAGGSLPKLPRTTDPKLLAALAHMQPVDNPAGSSSKQWILAEPGKQYFVYSATPAVRVDLSAGSGRWTVYRISLRDGSISSQESISGGGLYAVGGMVSAADAAPAAAPAEKFVDPEPQAGGGTVKNSRRAKGGKAAGGGSGGGRATVLWITR